mmetsp:Transcript_6756/g.7830  ORF Transcript_6756/g.7830 Transcript_6756/m.7830 type:complete len:220 (+) Transcript_6756:218-877(+)
MTANVRFQQTKPRSTRPFPCIIDIDNLRPPSKLPKIVSLLRTYRLLIPSIARFLRVLTASIATRLTKARAAAFARLHQLKLRSTVPSPDIIDILRLASEPARIASSHWSGSVMAPIKSTSFSPIISSPKHGLPLALTWTKPCNIVSRETALHRELITSCSSYIIASVSDGRNTLATNMSHSAEIPSTACSPRTSVDSSASPPWVKPKIETMIHLIFIVV